MKKYVLALDLRDDIGLIDAYDEYHKKENMRPAVIKSIKDAGILNMEIFRTGNRLFMIMETEDDFNFERKAAMDADNPDVKEWEDLMWNFQQPLLWAQPGEKWVLMDKIFSL